MTLRTDSSDDTPCALHRRCVTSLTALLLVVGLACDAPAETPEAPATPAAERVREVGVEVAPAGEWVEKVQAYGEVESATQVVIQASQGGKVKSVSVKVGDQVDEGAELLAFDEASVRNQLSQASGSARAAKAAIADARKELDELRAMERQAVFARSEVEAAEIRLRKAEEAYDDALLNSQRVRRDLADAVVRSPVAGTVVARDVEAEEVVSAGRELFEIVATDLLRVRTYVSEHQVNRIGAGSVASIRVGGARGRSYEGRVESTALTADPDTGNFEILVSLPNTQGAVRPGMTAEVELSTLPDTDLVVLPLRAVVERERRRVVYVVVDGVAEARFPILGIGNDSEVPCYEGIEPGEAVIVDGVTQVVDGVRVQVAEAARPEAAPADEAEPEPAPAPVPEPAPTPEAEG